MKMGVYTWTQPINFFYQVQDQLLKIKEELMGVYIWTQPRSYLIQALIVKVKVWETVSQIVTISGSQLVTISEAINKLDSISCIVSRPNAML